MDVFPSTRPLHAVPRWPEKQQLRGGELTEPLGFGFPPPWERTGVPRRNVWLQGWDRGRTIEPWDILLNQKVRKCSKNDGSKSKKHRYWLESQPNLRGPETQNEKWWYWIITHWIKWHSWIHNDTNKLGAKKALPYRRLPSKKYRRNEAIRKSPFRNHHSNNQLKQRNTNESKTSRWKFIMK